MGDRIAVVIGLRTNDHIAGTNRTVSIDLQTACALLPAAVVLFDLTDTAMTHRDTEGIDNIDVIAFPILHIDRTVETADDIVVPVVRGRFMRRTILFRYSGAHTAIRDILKDLRHAVVLIQIQVVRVVENMIGIRVEIDRVVAHLRYRQQLLTNHGCPYLFARLLAVMIAELNRIAPYMRSRIRQHDIMLIRHADTRNLESCCFAFCSYTVKLVVCLIVLHVRRVDTGARLTGNFSFSFHKAGKIVRRFQFGILHIRHAVVRPTGCSSLAGGGESTRPGVVSNDRHRFLERGTAIVVIQT